MTLPTEEIRLHESLSGTLDAGAVAARIPRTYLVKGMFFTRLVEVLGPAFARLLPTLQAPPRMGRYLPFLDYPQADYTRVAAAAAAHQHPGLALREALRRVARDDFATFADSTVGRVTLAVVGDAERALLELPGVYLRMAPGDWTFTAERLDARTVRLELSPQYGLWEYLLGQFEGLVLHFGQEPQIEVERIPPHRVRFDVQHRP